MALAVKCSRKFVKYCYEVVRDNLQIISNRHNCGRKKKTEEYPTLTEDIRKIMEDNAYTDPHFTTENQFTKLTIENVMQKLLDTGKYKEKFISASKLSSLLNELGYNLKKVKRNKPFKKIDEADAIFDNVNEKKKQLLKMKIVL